MSRRTGHECPEVVGFRLTTDELRRLDAQVKQSGLARAAYLRAVVLRVLPPECDECGGTGYVVNSGQNKSSGWQMSMPCSRGCLYRAQNAPLTSVLSRPVGVPADAVDGNPPREGYSTGPVPLHDAELDGAGVYQCTPACPSCAAITTKHGPTT